MVWVDRKRKIEVSCIKKYKSYAWGSRGTFSLVGGQSKKIHVYVSVGNTGKKVTVVAWKDCMNKRIKMSTTLFLQTLW